MISTSGSRAKRVAPAERARSSRWILQAAAFVAVVVGFALLRSLLAHRRVAALSLWVFPLGLAMIAYAWALPSAMEDGSARPCDTESILREGLS